MGCSLEEDRSKRFEVPQRVVVGCRSAGQGEGLVEGSQIALEDRGCSSLQNVAWQGRRIVVVTWMIPKGLRNHDEP